MTTTAKTRACVVALVLLGPASMLVQLQHDATNSNRVTFTLLHQYFEGNYNPALIGPGTSPAIFQARCLMRALLTAAMSVYSGDQYQLVIYNLTFQIAFAWGALFVLYQSARRHMAEGWAFAASLLGAAFVPWGFTKVANSTSYPYDLPALFFAACGVAAITYRRFGWLALTMIVGTLNKETLVFLIPAYALAEWPSQAAKGRLLLRCFALCVLFAVAYEEPRLLLAGDHASPVTFNAFSNPGVPRWHDNVQVLLLNSHGSPFENIYWVLLLYVPGLIAFRRLPWCWRAIYLCMPVFLLPVFFVGNIHEFRLFNELIPVGALSSAFVLSRLFPASTLEADPTAADSHSTA